MFSPPLLKIVEFISSSFSANFFFLSRVLHTNLNSCITKLQPLCAWKTSVENLFLFFF
jgi:hypothetical protein